jgi:hypothetical protein
MECQDRRSGFPLTNSKKKPHVPVAHKTSKGTLYLSSVENFLDSSDSLKIAGKVNLIFTSPPFILNRPKEYGHTAEADYVKWLEALAPRLKALLACDGSLVMELGNAWMPGKAAMSPTVMRAFLAFLDAGEFTLCQQFVWDNPARLPSPAQWVTVTRQRVKDSFTHLWWMSNSSSPKADNRRVLKPYSKSMEDLLRKQKYNSGKRPSGHNVSQKGFLTRHGGAIPSNVLDFPDDISPESYEEYIPSSLIRMSNTTAGDRYRKYCAEHGLTPHPAPMPYGLVGFFVKFLTDENDLVFDPFAGSNTTGAVSEALGRRWVGTEPDEGFASGSVGRFD